MPETAEDRSVRPSLLLALMLLFVGSGCSALIYEIVWFQLLQLPIGSSALSLGLLLGTFMGGMCLGSLLLPRLVSAQRHPLVVYAVIEFLIGGLGIALLYWLPFVGYLYTSNVDHSTSSIGIRALVCVVCLLPPAMLMGATLPAVARWMESTRVGISRLSFFYVANLFGAVIGCVVTSFVLLRLTNMQTTTFVAAGINLLVGCVALLVARAQAYTPVSTPAVNKDAVPTRRLVYITIALSGMTALAAEVIWTRMLSLLLGATVYTFSVILAVFLVGLGLGSGVGSYLAREVREPRIALARCQWLIGAAIAWSAYSLTRTIPYWPTNPDLYTAPWTQYQFDVARCLWAMFPATCLWGASFPLALAAAGGGQRDTGKLVAGVYAANTVGAIVGAVLSSLLLIGLLGTQLGQQSLILIAGGSSVLMFISCMKSPTDPGDSAHRRTWAVQVALIGPVLVLAVLMVPKIPPELVAAGRRIHEWRNDIPGLSEDDKVKYLCVREGTNASIAVSELSSGIRNFHVSGKVVASSEAKDMRLQRMLAHVPAMLHRNPRSVLVVGCGAGVTAGSFLVHPSVERVVICEIEPLVPKTAGEFFAEENYNVMQDPRTEVIHDDARHFITTTKEKFDIITSDPIHPWVRGAAALYSQDYYELCKRRLNDGGIVTQWVPLYETSEPAAKSAVATFAAAFPDATVWGNDVAGLGYDIVMLGQMRPLRIDANSLETKLNSEEFRDVRESLDAVEMGTTMQFLATLAAQRSDMVDWLKDAQINRDHNMRLQFLAGLSVNLDEADKIYWNMVRSRRFPEKIISSSGNFETALRQIYALQIAQMLGDESD